MFLFIQSIIVYGLMIWVMTYNGNIAYKRQYPQGYGGIDNFKNKKLSFASLFTKSYFFIPIFVFCLFSALRYKVGVDCEGYKQYFYQILIWGKVLEEGAVEPGFTFIGRLTAEISNTHHLMFFILAFLQISFIYYALRKKTYALIYIGVAIMLNFTYHALMNGVRQNIAACAFVAMLPLVLEKKRWPWFILCILIATLMHKSALILLPIGFIAYFTLQHGILSVPLQLIIYATCFLLMDKIDISYLESFFALGTEAGYSVDKAEEYSNRELTEKRFGAWAYGTYIVFLIIIIYSQKLKSLINKDKICTIIYNLFFIGACIGLLFYNNFSIGRLNLYLTIFQPIIISIMLFYTSRFETKFDKYVFWSIILLMSIKFILLLYSSSMLIDENILYKFDLFR